MNRDVLGFLQSSLWNEGLRNFLFVVFWEFHKLPFPQTSLKPGEALHNATWQHFWTCWHKKVAADYGFPSVWFSGMLDNANKNPGPVCGHRAKLIPRNPLQFLSERQFKKESRFSKQDIPRLLRCFQWSRSFTLANGYKFTAEISLSRHSFRSRMVVAIDQKKYFFPLL